MTCCLASLQNVRPTPNSNAGLCMYRCPSILLCCRSSPRVRSTILLAQTESDAAWSSYRSIYIASREPMHPCSHASTHTMMLKLLSVLSHRYYYLSFVHTMKPGVPVVCLICRMNEHRTEQPFEASPTQLPWYDISSATYHAQQQYGAFPS